MRVPEWFAWASGIASIVGGIASLGVLVAALLWRRMVEGLLRAVRLRSLAEELSDLEAEVAELADALQRGDGQVGGYVSQRATAHVGVVLARRGAALTADDLTDLNAIRSLLAAVCRDLSGARDMPPDALRRCATQVRRCGGLLATVSGHAESSVDQSVGKEH